ncbi:MAG: glycosyltransferase family 2 protein [Candidatus Hodarchaeales archaeon]|jgi:glycosyltransferase involved in cell wall biosynthesis
MKIVVAARCRNEKHLVERFLHGYSFADHIVISDGGSIDGTVEMLENRDKVILHHFDQEETIDGVTWNPDAPHMNFVIEKAKELNPDWLIFDDFDDVPNSLLKQNARYLLTEVINKPQVNAFRLYMWGDTQFFPKMNSYFHDDYTSIWAWKPSELDIKADPEIHHGTLIGYDSDPHKLQLPTCLLHKSWHPDTIDEKMKRQNAVGIQMHHPLEFAGEPEELPKWAKE